jgi:hypothetical protein
MACDGVMIDCDAMGVSKEIIADEQGYRIVYYRHAVKPNKLIITFDPHGHDIRDAGFGCDVSLESGFDNIFISHRFNSQYQELSLDQFASHVLPFIEGYEVYTYGSSLGGYCAIYYAGAVNARAIALSPRNSAHPSISSPLFSHVSFAHSDCVMSPSSMYPPTILFDHVQEVDRKFIQDFIVPAYPEARLVDMPYAGHLIAEALLEVGLLKAVVLDIINHDVVNTVDLSQYDSSYWCAEIGYEEIRSGNPLYGASYLIRSLKIRHDPAHLDELIALARSSEIPASFLNDVIQPYLCVINESGLFDADWYVSMYGHTIQGELAPVLHYLLYGGYNQNCPSPKFDSEFYLENNQDVRASGMNPLLHYVLYGQFEGRIASSD